MMLLAYSYLTAFKIHCPFIEPKNLHFSVSFLRDINIKILTPFQTSVHQLMKEMSVFWMVRSTRTARRSSPPASISVCAVMGRSPACRAATWTWCCLGRTAPCHGGSRYQESAVRSGCVSPRLKPVHWVALPWQVRRLEIQWDGIRPYTQIKYRYTIGIPGPFLSDVGVTSVWDTKLKGYVHSSDLSREKGCRNQGRKKDRGK